MSKNIAIGGDHAGYHYKQQLLMKLKSDEIEIKDFGPFSDESADYPDFVHPVAKAIENKEFDFGILICASGNGVAMSANKHQGIRAALCWNNELSQLARGHNDANILCIPARYVSLALAIEMVDVFLKTEFLGGRHARRVDKINC